MVILRMGCIPMVHSPLPGTSGSGWVLEFRIFQIAENEYLTIPEGSGKTPYNQILCVSSVEHLKIDTKRDRNYIMVSHRLKRI